MEAVDREYYQGLVAELRKETERLRAALEEVVDPVGALKKRAEAKGDRLSGMAYSICNEVGYLKNIARAALSNGD